MEATKTIKSPLDLNPKKHIIIKDARVHNLKSVDVAIPRNKFVVITGVSGSGKSSLAIDTLYAEGQRRYVESLSSYARQFLMRMDKPEVEYIKGISPAIAIEQKVSTRSSRSTVGSLTEIYDYMRLLYARLGETISPISGNPVKKHEVRDVVDFVKTLSEGSKIQVLFPYRFKKKKPLQKELELLSQKGYIRIALNGNVYRLKHLDENPELFEALKKTEEINIVLDRLAIKNEETEWSRLSDSVETAFFESGGDCLIEVIGEKTHHFSNRFELDGITFEEPNPHFFNFNSPFGACPTCEGFGQVIGLDEDLIVPDKNKSVYEGALAPWRGEKMKNWLDRLVRSAMEFDFPIHRSYKHLTTEEKELLWTGNEYFQGLNEFFKELEQQSYKIQYRVMLSRYRGRTVCTECKGSRLRKEASYVKFKRKSIQELMSMPVEALQEFFKGIVLNKHEEQVAGRLIYEINSRLNFMLDVGLPYLTLNRLSSTLSGGETQRINLTRSLGSNLTDSLYILDEPSIGLHPRDTNRLINVLKALKDLGNTVIVVEHEEEMMRAADHIIDMGPRAGHLGGEIIASGNYEEIIKQPKSLTGAYLSGVAEVPLPKQRRKSGNHIKLSGVTHNNLKNVDVKFPLNTLTVVSGVSGSGKTTLIRQVLVPALIRALGGTADKPGDFDELSGDIKSIGRIEMVDQNPIGKSSRSNPVTYIKAYDAIRELYANQQLAKMRGFKPKHFSFNVEGGRCEHCKGEGETLVEMQFLADIHLTCEVCKGKRFKEEVLDVTYQGVNIFDLLNMNISQAIEFFSKDKQDIAEKLKPLEDVGLGYVKLGQSSNTLSGGEAQRVKLASFIGKGSSDGKIFFVFDEPTTGLHFHDINKLLSSFNALIEQGHTVLVIEHNSEVIKCADHVIDLGPEGGEKGGNIVFEGTPKALAEYKESYTGRFLKEKIFS